MTNNLPQQAPQKKKNNGLLIGLIVGGGILVMIAITFGIVSLTSMLLGNNAKNIVGSGDPRDNSTLIEKAEGLSGVESVDVICSNPLPWSYQNCTLQVFVNRAITEPEVKAIGEALIPEVAKDFGSAPRGISIIWSDESKNTFIATPAFLNETELTKATPLFMRALSNPAVIELSSENARGDYYGIVLSVEPDYAVNCVAGQEYSEQLKQIGFVHGDLPRVTFHNNAFARSDAVQVCDILLSFLDEHQDVAQDVSHINVRESVISIGFQPRSADSLKSGLREELARTLEGTSFTIK